MAPSIVKIRFHLFQLAHLHMWTLVGLFGAAALVLACLVAWLTSNQYIEDVQAQLEGAERRARNLSVSKPLEHGGDNAKLALPKLDSGQLAGSFERIAQEVGLVIEEVAYTLDESGSQPYVRYRMNLSVQSNYPKIRKFLAAASAEFPHVSMDSIACAREKAGVQAVGCKLTFSAFFSKAQ